jgi:hypothetical protein
MVRNDLSMRPLRHKTGLVTLHEFAGLANQIALDKGRTGRNRAQ